MNLREAPKQVLTIIGPPASGKGTLSNILSKKFDMPIITPGNIYKVLREQEGDLGDLVRASLEGGGYCPDWLTNKIVFEESEQSIGKGIIFDGYPRTIKQLSYLFTNYQVIGFIHVNADYHDLYDAAMNRRECAGCKTVYTLKNIQRQCCAAYRYEGVQRWDDTPEIFPLRHETYIKSTQPLIEAINDLHTYKIIKMLGNPEQASDIQKLVESLNLN